MKIKFTNIAMIISVILLAITIPIDIYMGYYLHAFTTCLWIFISICAYKTAKLLSFATHVIHLQGNLINKLEEFIAKIELILEEPLRQVSKDKSVEEGMIEDINELFDGKEHYTD